LISLTTLLFLSSVGRSLAVHSNLEIGHVPMESHHSKVVKFVIIRVRLPSCHASSVTIFGVGREPREPLVSAIAPAIAGRYVAPCIRGSGTYCAAYCCCWCSMAMSRAKGILESIRVGGSDDNVDELHGSATLPFCFPTCFFTTPPWPSSLLSQMGNLNFIPTTQAFPPDLLLCFI
jgi:hypothetical protein